MTISEEIIAVATLLAKHRKIALSTMGAREMGHSRFFARLAAGSVTIRRAEAAMKHLSDQWPSDLPWPSDIPRPPITATDAS